MEIKPFDPWTLVLISLLNPVVIAVAFYMGRLADQPQKLVFAFYATSLAEFYLFWLAGAVGMMCIQAFGGEAAILVMQLFPGLLWAGLGYWMRTRTP